jgi:HEAT repeat protein
MYGVLLIAILIVGGVFLALTLLIVGNKAWRETVTAWRRARRRELEPAVLGWAHGDEVSLIPVLGGETRWGDRRVLEEILLDHVQRVRGIEKQRLGRALDEIGYVDEYLNKLRNGRWWWRADAAEKLGLAGARRATSGLVSALRDPVYEVRLRAAKALGALGGVAAVRPLVSALREPNRWSTIRVADILATMGTEVVEELIDSFDGLERHARLAALDILARIRSLHSASWLEQQLGHVDPDVRARACHAVGSVGNPDSGPALMKALNDDEWPVRAMAAKSLGRIQHARAIDELCNALRDPQWWVRVNAAEALRLMAPAGVDALKRMLDDQDGYARHQAVLMLEEAGVVDEIVGRLADEELIATNGAVGFITKVVGIGQLGRLRELMETHADPRVRAFLARLVPVATESDTEVA